MIMIIKILKMITKKMMIMIMIKITTNNKLLSVMN